MTACIGIMMPALPKASREVGANTWEVME